LIFRKESTSDLNSLLRRFISSSLSERRRLCCEKEVEGREEEVEGRVDEEGREEEVEGREDEVEGRVDEDEEELFVGERGDEYISSEEDVIIHFETSSDAISFRLLFLTISFLISLLRLPVISLSSAKDGTCGLVAGLEREIGVGVGTVSVDDNLLDPAPL
jgi:hypothetical protein